MGQLFEDYKDTEIEGIMKLVFDEDEQNEILE